MATYYVRAFDKYSREYVYTLDAESPAGAVRRAFAENDVRAVPGGPELGSVVWVSEPLTPGDEAMFLVGFVVDEAGAEVIDTVVRVPQPAFPGVGCGGWGVG